MFLIAVCDDDPVLNRKIRELTENCLREASDKKFSVRSFNDAEDLLDAISQTHFDIVTMDIELGVGQNGIQTAQRINQISPDTRIIFITAFHKYCFDVYDARHIYYIVKDRLAELLPKAVRRCLDTSAPSEEATVVLRYKGKADIIRRDQILYVEKQLRLAVFHLADGDPHKVYMKFSDVLSLIGSADFVRCHRSFIVNMRHITELKGNFVRMTDGSLLPIGGNYKEAFQHCFLTAHSRPADSSLPEA